MKNTARSLKYTLSFMFAVLLSGVMVPQSHAACSSGNRINHTDAECLNAAYASRSGWRAKKSTYWAENKCSDHETVVAKIDRSGVSDATWHLTDGTRRSGSYLAAINGISCCTDEGGICNKSDLTVSACTERFNESDARGACFTPSFSVNDQHLCTISTSCQLDAGGYNSTTVTLHFWKIDRLKSCNGTLKVSYC